MYKIHNYKQLLQYGIRVVPSSMTYFCHHLLLDNDFFPRDIGPDFLNLTFSLGVNNALDSVTLTLS